MEILIIGAVIGLIPAAIAKSKGRSFVLWWIFGAFLFIVALPAALLMKADTAPIEQGKLREGMKKCPFCAELIKLEANVCRYCCRELNRPSPFQFQSPQTKVDPFPFSFQSPQTKATRSTKATRYRIIGEEMSTHRHVEIPNWEAPDIATAKRLAAEIGVVASRIEPMDAPNQEQCEVTDAPVSDRDFAWGRNVAIAAIPVPRHQATSRKLGLGLIVGTALLAIVGFVAWQTIASIDNHTKATFQGIADRLGSPSHDSHSEANVRRAAVIMQGAVDRLSSSSDSATNSFMASTKLTLINFGRIQTGMSFLDVEDILGVGSKTVVKSESTEAIEWQDGSRIVTCMFQNGKLVQKAQAGLD